MSMDANDLILFAQVMETGSFSRAAERTGLPKSTLSRRITTLETKLGERLLTRSTRMPASSCATSPATRIQSSTSRR